MGNSNNSTGFGQAYDYQVLESLGIPSCSGNEARRGADGCSSHIIPAARL